MGVLRGAMKMAIIFLPFQSRFLEDPPGVTLLGNRTGQADTWNGDQPIAFRSARPQGSRRTSSVDTPVPSRVHDESSQAQP